MAYDTTYHAYYDYGPRTKGTRAIVLHFTEGNGGIADVRYVASATVARGVSCNFVITKDGKIWQLLDWDHASGSINPHELRVTDDKAFKSPDDVKVVFGVTAAKTALGDAWFDPNACVVSVEIAGKAADGPTDAQTSSIVRLVEDFRNRYGAKKAALGHRDFQDYKPCPGKLIKWGTIGGHGIPVSNPAPDPELPQTQEDEVITRIKAEDWTPATGRPSSPLRAKPDRAESGIGVVNAGKAIRSIAEVEANGENWRLTEYDGTPAYLLRSDFEPVVPGGDPATAALLDALLSRQPPASPPVVTVNGKQVYP